MGKKNKKKKNSIWDVNSDEQIALADSFYKKGKDIFGNILNDDYDDDYNHGKAAKLPGGIPSVFELENKSKKNKKSSNSKYDIFGTPVEKVVNERNATPATEEHVCKCKEAKKKENFLRTSLTSDLYGILQVINSICTSHVHIGDIVKNNKLGESDEMEEFVQDMITRVVMTQYPNAIITDQYFDEIFERVTEFNSKKFVIAQLPEMVVSGNNDFLYAVYVLDDDFYKNFIANTARALTVYSNAYSINPSKACLTSDLYDIIGDELLESSNSFRFYDKATVHQYHINHNGETADFNIKEMIHNDADTVIDEDRFADKTNNFVIYDYEEEFELFFYEKFGYGEVAAKQKENVEKAHETIKEMKSFDVGGNTVHVLDDSDDDSDDEMGDLLTQALIRRHQPDYTAPRYEQEPEDVEEEVVEEESTEVTSTVEYESEPVEKVSVETTTKSTVTTTATQTTTTNDNDNESFIVPVFTK